MDNTTAKFRSSGGRFGGQLLFLPVLLLAIVSASAAEEPKASARVPAAPGAASPVGGNPWGVASGAEWQAAYPQFNPLLNKAGVKWLRAFQEWQTIEPKRGYWNWAAADHMVQNARANDVHLAWVLAYLAPWASADGGTRTFPIKDIQDWRNYVRASVSRYHDDIKYWEVWNEFNGSFADGGTPRIYAELVREASIAAKAVDPTARIGLSAANFDVHFLDQAIKAGAAGHFDFVCVHPYEKMAILKNGGEVEFLSMAASLRTMLADNGQPRDMPLWITEVGEQSSVGPQKQADSKQAVVLAKTYLLALASGFQKIFWFEARGPASGDSGDFGIIRRDFSLRPSYTALHTMTDVLGSAPVSKGWVELGNGGFGFVFATGGKDVLVAWAPATGDIKLKLGAAVRVTDLEGKQTVLNADDDLLLTRTPVLISGIPDKLVQTAERNKDEPFSWGGNFARAEAVRLKLGSRNIEDGIKQLREETTVAVGGGGDSGRRMDFVRADGEGHYAYFSVSPAFARTATGKLAITVLARRSGPDKNAGFKMTYESKSGYVSTEYANIPEGTDWQELVWNVDDANFVGQWGWNFRIDAISSPNEFMVDQISIKRRVN